MRGSYSRFKWHFPASIIHNDGKDPDRIKRYSIGRRRISFLKNNCQPFAFGSDSDGNHTVAFLVELELDDLSADMPLTMKYEYIAGSIYPNEDPILFAYLWFNSLNEAKNYVLGKKMKLEGGWNNG